MAYNDEEKWAATRSSIGMSMLDKTEAKGLTNNEFIAIASSFAMGIDYTDTFDMWGVAIGEKARAQIAALQLKRIERVFFDINGIDHKRGALSKVNQVLKPDIHRVPISKKVYFLGISYMPKLAVRFDIAYFWSFFGSDFFDH